MTYTDYIDALKKYEAELAKHISEYKVYKDKCVEYANFLNRKYADFINKRVKITWCGGGRSLKCFFNGFKVKEGILDATNFSWSYVQMDISQQTYDGWIYCVQVMPPLDKYFDDLVFEEI